MTLLGILLALALEREDMGAEVRAMAERLLKA